MFACLIIFFATLFSSQPAKAPQPQPVDLVDPLVGTAAQGQTFPAAGVPFAMTQWTPQTRDGEKKCTAPYYFADTHIEGFRGSHFLSGSCTQDYGSITLMPETGDLKLGMAERASYFSRNQEHASPYQYAVTLQDYGLQVGMTGTARAGILRIKASQSGKVWVLVQDNSPRGDGSVTADLARGEIACLNPVRRLYAGAGKYAGFNGYSVVYFDHPFQLGGTWSGNARHPGQKVQQGDEGSPGVYVSFDLRAGETLQVKIGTSFTSMEEARRNLQAEIPGWNYDRVVSNARDAWNAALGKIQIQDGSGKGRIFYTALYHSLLLPRIFSDVNGTYPEFAGGGKIETAVGFTYYGDYSLWDTFRAVHPLLTILDPGRELDMVKSLIAKGDEGGFLPIYPAWNSYTSEMTGDHADSIIADSYFKGIRDFDIQDGYRLMRRNATELPRTQAEYIDGKGRRGLESYLRYGYIPLEDHVAGAFHKDEQVSRTLEYAYDDFLVGRIADALGKQQDAALFGKRAQNYRKVIDPSVGFARGRHADGSWSTPFNPAVPYPYITEGLPYQDTFFVPQDIPGLMQWVGGRVAFVNKLDGLFAGGYYDGGNEPSQQIAYLYDNAGEAWKAQQQIRSLLDRLYFDRPDGLPGNDDCGQMSAWYVMSALGFYPVTPGVPIYEIGTPLFDQATIELPGGKTFRIVAKGASEGKIYISSATLNGKPLSRFWIRHAEIVRGGDLVFQMSSSPNPHWPKNAGK